MKLTEEDKECAFNGTFLRTKIAFISRAPGADLRMEEFKIMVQIDGVRTNRTPTGLFFSTFIFGEVFNTSSTLLVREFFVCFSREALSEVFHFF